MKGQDSIQTNTKDKENVTKQEVTTTKDKTMFSVSDQDKFIAMLQRNPIYKIFLIIDKDKNKSIVEYWVKIIMKENDKPELVMVTTNEVLDTIISININEDNSLQILNVDKKFVYMAEPFGSIKRKQLVYANKPSIKKYATDSKSNQSYKKNTNNRKINRNEKSTGRSYNRK